MSRGGFKKENKKEEFKIPVEDSDCEDFLVQSKNGNGNTAIIITNLLLHGNSWDVITGCKTQWKEQQHDLSFRVQLNQDLD